MRVQVDPEGNMLFRGLSPLCAETLLRMPETLRDDDPAIRARIFPDAYGADEAEAAEDWKNYAVPELEHLYASRLELVEKDLTTLREDEDSEYAIFIPVQHRYAWLSALNAARLSMFIGADLEAEDMEAEPGDLGDIDQDVALMRIHFLAFMQELILEVGGMTDREVGGDEDPDGGALDEE